jgi:hypothetical protein
MARSSRPSGSIHNRGTAGTLEAALSKISVKVTLVAACQVSKARLMAARISCLAIPSSSPPK